MPRTKLENQSPTVKEKYQEYLEAKKEEQEQKRKLDAQKTLNSVEDYFREKKEVVSTLEEIYNLAKEIFFQVNGARRVLKND